MLFPHWPPAVMAFHGNAKFENNILPHNYRFDLVLCLMPNVMHREYFDFDFGPYL